MSIKRRIKFKSDRDRGTRDANGAPLDLSDNAKASDDARMTGGVSSDAQRDPNDIFWINEDEEYSKHLAKFFKGKK